MNLTGTTVQKNSAMFGGGILCDGSSFSATKSKIANNSATSVGAGFASLGNSKAMSFISATVSNNSLTNGGYAGGGLYLTNGTLNTSGNFNLINNSITSTTSSTIQGAGIYATGTTINFNGGASAVSMISKNSLTSNGSATGAGLFLSNSATLNQISSLAIINNTITSNNGSIAGNGVGAGVAFASGASFNNSVNNALSIANGGFERIRRRTLVRTGTHQTLRSAGSFFVLTRCRRTRTDAVSASAAVGAFCAVVLARATLERCFGAGSLHQGTDIVFP